MQYPLFPLSHLVGIFFFRRGDIFQQTLLQTGRNGKLSRPGSPFRPVFCKLHDCRGDTSDWMNVENQMDTADMMHFPNQSGV